MSPAVAATDGVWRPAAAGGGAIFAEAARLLRGGALVGFPTETVYGVGALATSGDAIAALYAAKRRPANKPLIIHLSRRRDADAFAEIGQLAALLMRRFWPGPLTLVLRRRPSAPLAAAATSGLASVALRLPAHPAAALLIDAAGPLAASSANLSGAPAALTATAVGEALGGTLAMIIDGGELARRAPSTIICLTGIRPRLLRPGAIGRAGAGIAARPAGLQRRRGQ